MKEWEKRREGIAGEGITEGKKGEGETEDKAERGEGGGGKEGEERESLENKDDFSLPPPPSKNDNPEG